jgi:hypothetical protein
MSLTSTSDAILVESDAPEAVSWGAIIAGAIAAFGVTLVLAALGTGMGLSAISPWANSGVSVTTFAISTAIWLVVMQWLASAIGGYLAGRLRLRSPETLPDDAYFRDTAHGLLAWALATVMIALVFGSSIGGLISGGTQLAGSVMRGAASGATQAIGSGASSLPTAYFVDSLFRPGQTANAPATATTASAGTADANGSFGDMKAEATQILATDLANGSWTAPDKAQLAHLIAVHTNMSDADAQHRVDEVLAQIDAAKLKAQQAADSARKAALSFAIMTALSLIIGAFIASVCGALGGHLRDEA